MQLARMTRLIEQLQQLGIRDEAVLDAVSQVPREHFVSQAMLHQAYDNNALPIGYGQTISQPYIVARMTSLLSLNTDSHVLEVGTGSGYQTAVLSHLLDRVHTIERIKSLQWDAKRRLKVLDRYNIAFKHGDGWEGWDNKAPFDAILVTAAASYLPMQLVDQLKLGGKMVIPIGEEEQQLMLLTKTECGVESQQVEAVRFVPLISGELA